MTKVPLLVFILHHHLLIHCCLYILFTLLFCICCYCWNYCYLMFLSATEYFPSRTIIQPGWVSSSSSSLSLSLLLSFRVRGRCRRRRRRCRRCRRFTFLQWDNLRTLWAIKLKFCMVTSHDIVLWLRIRELISPTQTGPTSQPAKNSKMGWCGHFSSD